jgi:hypothetical protein
MKTTLKTLAIAAVFAFCFALHAGAQQSRSDRRPQASRSNYLFAYFKNDGEDGLHLAWSRDGLKWQPLNEDRSYPFTIDWSAIRIPLARGGVAKRRWKRVFAQTLSGCWGTILNYRADIPVSA